MFVKVCGIRTVDEVKWAINLGYDAIGIVVYPKSKRFVTAEKTKKILNFAKNKIKTVVVSLFYKDIEMFSELSDFIQIYEKPPEKTEKLILAGDKEPTHSEFAYYLYDASRGGGELNEFPCWIGKHTEKIILAGGLNHKNITDIINKFHPFGVDVSSGVEEYNKKNYKLMKKFIENLRRNNEGILR